MQRVSRAVWGDCPPLDGLWGLALLAVTAAGATVIASPLYYASGLAFASDRLDYGFGFALFGVFLNLLPPVLVWACARWIR